jgi:hypothetical protein
MLSVTLTLAFRRLLIPDSQFSKTWRRKAILSYGGKGDSGLSYFGIDEISLSHLMETQKCRKAYLIKQSYLINH